MCQIFQNKQYFNNHLNIINYEFKFIFLKGKKQISSFLDFDAHKLKQTHHRTDKEISVTKC